MMVLLVGWLVASFFPSLPHYIDVTILLCSAQLSSTALCSELGRLASSAKRQGKERNA